MKLKHDMAQLRDLGIEFMDINNSGVDTSKSKEVLTAFNERLNIMLREVNACKKDLRENWEIISKALTDLKKKDKSKIPRDEFLQILNNLVDIIN